MEKSDDEILERYLETLDIDLNGAKANLHGWSVNIAKRNCEKVAIVISKGAELHFVPLVQGKAMSRRNIIEAVKPILDEYGYVTTRVPVCEEDHRLRLKLGFVNTWSDNDFSYWALTELPYHKEKANEPAI